MQSNQITFGTWWLCKKAIIVFGSNIKNRLAGHNFAPTNRIAHVIPNLELLASSKSDLNQARFFKAVFAYYPSQQLKPCYVDLGSHLVYSANLWLYRSSSQGIG